MSVLTFRGKGGEEDCLLRPVTNPVRFFAFQVLLNFRSQLKLHFLRQASPNTLNKEAPSSLYSLPPHGACKHQSAYHNLELLCLLSVTSTDL